MAIATVSKTGVTLDFGISTDATAGTVIAGMGPFVSAELGNSLETSITAKDEDGDVVAHAYGNQKFSLSAEGYAPTSGSLPVVGAAMQVKGQKGKIMSVTITASNENWLMVKVTGEGYTGLVYA